MARLKDEYASRMVAELEKKLGTTIRLAYSSLSLAMMFRSFLRGPFRS